MLLVVAVVQSLSCVRFSVIPWTAAHQASLSLTNSQSLFKGMSIKLVMPSNHLILCYSLLLLPSLFLSIRVFSNGSALHISWPYFQRFSYYLAEHGPLAQYDTPIKHTNTTPQIEHVSIERWHFALLGGDWTTPRWLDIVYALFLRHKLKENTKSQRWFRGQSPRR